MFFLCLPRWSAVALLIAVFVLLIEVIPFGSTTTTLSATFSENAIDDPDNEYHQLKEIYTKNLLEDYPTIRSTSDEIPIEIEQVVRRRVHSFKRANQERKNHTRYRRSAVDEKAIDADTAAARHLYLKGFRERGNVPVNFPVDICLLRVGKTIYAAALHKSESSNRTSNATTLSFYRRIKGQFEKYYEYQTVTARYFDCISIAKLGLVAVVNYHDHEFEAFENGSPVFQISEDGTTEIVQTFGQSNLNTVHMWVYATHIFLTHTYINLDETRRNVCPVYRWSGYFFDIVDHMPCNNAKHIEAFSIDQQMFVVVANSMTEREKTFSNVFVLNPDTQKLELHQQIYIYSVSHIAYFYFDERDQREHFLITGNSLAADEGTEKKARDFDKNSIVYKFIDGFFVPVQNIDLTSVKMFLPVVHENGEFLMLILTHDQPLLIYEYNGWKFVPSKIDYTGEAFAAGVSYMRVYRHIVNASVIVIANTNLFSETVNLFSPTYGMKNDLRRMYGEFIEWCQYMTERMSQVDLQALYNELLTFPEVEDGAMKFDSPVELLSSSVDVIHAHELHTKHMIFDDAMADYINEVTEYFGKVQEKIDKAEAIIQNSLKLNETVHWNGDLNVTELIASSSQMKQLDAKVLNNAAHRTREAAGNGTYMEDALMVDVLIVDNILDVQFLNGYAFDTMLFRNNIASFKDLTVTAKKVTVTGNVYVKKLIDGIFFHPSNVLLPDVDQDFSNTTLLVRNLTVNHLIAPRINSTEMSVVYRMIEQAKTLLSKLRGINTPYGSEFKFIEAKELKVMGLVNGMNTSYIYENILRTAGDQRLSDKLVVEHIYAENVFVKNNRVSGVDLDNLVLIAGDQDQVVEQDVQFVEPLYVNNLQINERLNHIPVIDGKLQILNTNTDEPQVITGTKTFDYLTILEPIDLQGKIKGDSLRKINPIVTIYEDLYLEGDYIIRGNATIHKLLNATNIYGASGTYNINRVISHGLRVDIPMTTNQTFMFHQPVFVNHMYADRINDLDINDIVIQHSKEIQHVTGKKTFLGDLYIDGLANANEINNVDLHQLNRTLFRTTGPQEVDGVIHFKEIIAPVVRTKNTIFGGRPLNRLLQQNTYQEVTAPVRFENCTIYVDDLIVTDLHLDNDTRVFGYDLSYLLRDTVLPPQPGKENEAVLITGKKTFRNLTVGELVLMDEASFNGVPMELLNFVTSNDGKRTILLNETYEFPPGLNIKHLIVDGKINGISMDRFCHGWLSKEGNQTFTAPQTFENIIAEQVYVDGYVNNVKLDELFANVYRTDREEYVDHAVFHDGLVSYEPVTVGGLVSGLNLSRDVLSKQSTEMQYLDEVYIDGHLNVQGELHVLNTLNGVSYPKLKEFCVPTDLTAPFNIDVRGTVYFEEAPIVANINGYNVHKLHSEIWLPNRYSVLTGNYYFESVEFRAPFTYSGLINHLDPEEAAARCLTNTTPQNITTPLIFTGDVVFHEMAIFETVDLKGLLKSTESSPGIDLAEYRKYALRNDIEQNITGKWVFHNAEIHDGFELKTLNGYDVETELFRDDRDSINFTGSKTFRELHVRNLICPPPCIIQGVDIDEWYANAVRLDGGNQTIEGTVYIDDAVVTDNIEVLGFVNGTKYDADHLLLKNVPQDVNGTLRIVTKFPEANKIFPLVVESLDVETLNGKNVDKFLTNLARADENPLIINTPVTFEGILETDELVFENDMLFGTNLTQLLAETSFEDSVASYASQVRSLNSVSEKMQETLDDNKFVFSHFDRMGKMLGNIEHMAVLTLNIGKAPMELLVVHRGNSNYGRGELQFSRWNHQDLWFKHAKGFFPIRSHTGTIIGMKRLTLNRKEHLFVEFYDPNIRYYTQRILHLEPDDLNQVKKHRKLVPLYEMNSTVSMNVIPIKIADLHCIGMYSQFRENFEIRCLKVHNFLQLLDVHQILPSGSLRQVVALENHVILLGQDGRIQVWRTSVRQQLIFHQYIKVMNPTHFTVARYERQLMLAVNSQHQEKSAHHGSIEIWRKQLMSNATFVHHQRIMTKLPKQIQFSVLLTKELLLYTLTENWLHPLVIYRYEGVTGFRDVLTTNTIHIQAKRMSVLKLKQSQKEVIAIIGANATHFVEVVYYSRS